ncbi:MAG: hypothetical protein WA051_00330 [Minisyncoccia bacterium]
MVVNSTNNQIKKKDLEILYFSRNLSVAQIAKSLKCSENKINYWIKVYGLRKRSIKDAIYIRKNPKGDPFSFIKPKTLAHSFLFGLGVGLYWGEGTKASKDSVRLGNTDPDLILYFLKFLSDIYSVDKSKLRFGIQVFEDLDSNEVISFWSKKLNINKKAFLKVTKTKSRGVGTYKKKIKYGVLTIYFNNVKLRNILMMEIERLRKQR